MWNFFDSFYVLTLKSIQLELSLHIAKEKAVLPESFKVRFDHWRYDVRRHFPIWRDIASDERASLKGFRKATFSKIILNLYSPTNYF